MAARGLALALCLWPAFAQGKPPASKVPPPKPPAPLVCVERWFAAHALEKDGSWYVAVPGGERFLYEFSTPKSYEERLRVPDIHDMFALRYPTGPITPITTVDADPGRVRHVPLFDATYPAAALAKLRFLEQTITVHKKVVAPFERVAARIKRLRAADPSLAPFFEKLGESFSDKAVAGTARASAHAYGIAIDLNPALSNYWRWQKPTEPVTWTNRIPEKIVAAFEAEGFIWGGRWYHYDTAHFEYRPELLDAGCYPK